MLASGETAADGSVRNSASEQIVSPSRICVLTEVLLEFRWRGRGGESCRLGRGAKACKQVRPARSWSRHEISLPRLVYGGDLAGRSNAKPLDVRSLPTRSKAGAWYTQTVGEGVVRLVGHLSKAASVETHDDCDGGLLSGKIVLMKNIRWPSDSAQLLK